MTHFLTSKNIIMARFLNEKFEKWEEENHIPQDTMEELKAVCKDLGISEPRERTITYYNRGGYLYAYAKGFTYSYCTSSYEDGPEEDCSGALIDVIRGLGFEIANSYGDNGMDYTTNYRDTYWNYDFALKNTIVDSDLFFDYQDEEDCDTYDY